MKKKYVVVAVAALVFTAAFTAAAQQVSGMRYHHGSFLIRHLVHELNLSTDQRAAIKQILAEERPALQELCTKAQQQRAQLRSMSTFDEEKVRTIAQANSSSYVDLVVERERIRSKIFAVLTPEQQNKVNQLTGEFRQGMQDRLSHLGDNL